MNEIWLDPVLAEWLGKGPEQGSEHGRNRALAAVHKVDQKAEWRFPRWWLPAPVADVQVFVPRAVSIGFGLVLTLLVLVALALSFGALIRNAPLLLAPNEAVIAFSEAGRIYVVNPDGSNRRDLNVGWPTQRRLSSHLTELGSRSWHPHLRMAMARDCSSRRWMARDRTWSKSAME